MAKAKKKTAEEKGDGVIAELQAMFGDDVVTTIGSKDVRMVDCIPTGSLGLDKALGVGGIPVGRITEVYGKESSGKTSLAISIAREAQRKFPNKRVAFIDAEHAFDSVYAQNIGLDVTKMLFSQPDYGEQGLDIVIKLAESEAFSLIVIDSVSALTPLAEIEGEMRDQTIGLQARIMSKALRKLAGPANRTNTAVLFINQVRANIGAMGYGPKETTTGGKGLKFFASVRLDTRVIKKEENNVRVKTKVVKNKVAPPFREVEYDIDFGEGISVYSELIDYGIEMGLVQKKGAWFNYGDTSLGQGKEKAKLFLGENQEIYDELYVAVRKYLLGE